MNNPELSVDEMTTRIMDQLSLGDHLYPDVEAVVRGKLVDKLKLLRQPRRDGLLFDENFLMERVKGVMEEFLGVSFELMKETATYYQNKSWTF